MERERTFIEKLIVQAWDIIVFLGVFMFAIQIPYEICNFLNIKATFTIIILAIVGCIYLYGKSSEIKNRDSLTVKGFEQRLVLSYRCANDENKTTVKNTLKLKDYDEEKY
jgi:hypothetical protein